MKFREVLRISRPRFWLYEAATFGLVGTVGALQGISFFSDWRYWVFAFYFLIPANILIFGALSRGRYLNFSTLFLVAFIATLVHDTIFWNINSICWWTKRRLGCRFY